MYPWVAYMGGNQEQHHHLRGYRQAPLCTKRRGREDTSAFTLSVEKLTHSNFLSQGKLPAHNRLHFAQSLLEHPTEIPKYVVCCQE